MIQNFFTPHPRWLGRLGGTADQLSLGQSGIGDDAFGGHCVVECGEIEAVELRHSERAEKSRG